jgi:hypothetical protein
MTKFESIGVQYQRDADSKQEANKLFLYSCKCCCEKGMRIECDRCAIAHAHAMVVACFADNEVVA